jgi:ABC-2 type transport system ATP-binding protein
VREYLHSLARRKTIILTTHNMDEAERLVDRVAIIDHGQLLVLDTPQALKAQVGAGDVLEIGFSGELSETDAARLKTTLEEQLNSSISQLHLDSKDRLLSVHALNAIGLLSTILEGIRQAGLQPGEVHLRANTLEDVFIQLTGRRLRE